MLPRQLRCSALCPSALPPCSQRSMYSIPAHISHFGSSRNDTGLRSLVQTPAIITYPMPKRMPSRSYSYPGTELIRSTGNRPSNGFSRINKRPPGDLFGSMICGRSTCRTMEIPPYSTKRPFSGDMTYVRFCIPFADMDVNHISFGEYSVSWEVHARCVHAFLAGLGGGVDVNFSKRTLALVGHSMGGNVR